MVIASAASRDRTTDATIQASAGSMADSAGKGQRRVLDGLDTAALRGRQIVHHRHDVPY